MDEELNQPTFDNPTGTQVVLSEAETKYLTEIYKNKVEKWRDINVLREVRGQASFTAKTLTKETIEGNTPMCYILERLYTEGQSGLRMVLYRC
jgi:hypothetical protein